MEKMQFFKKKKLVNQLNLCWYSLLRSHIFFSRYLERSLTLYLNSVIIVYLLNRFFKLSRFLFLSLRFAFAVEMLWMVVNGAFSCYYYHTKTWNALASIFQHNFTKPTHRHTTTINNIRRFTYFPAGFKSSFTAKS